jgi:hypothetical protein
LLTAVPIVSVARIAIARGTGVAWRHFVVPRVSARIPNCRCRRIPIAAGEPDDIAARGGIRRNGQDDRAVFDADRICRSNGIACQNDQSRLRGR